MARAERLGPTQSVNEIWAIYMEKHGNVQDLFGLLKNPRTKPEFWKKAIDTFLIKGISTITVDKEAPESLYEDEGDNTQEISWIQELSKPQVLYLVGELPHYISDPNNKGNVSEYNSMILDLLPILSDYPEKYSVGLFKSFDPFVGLRDLFRRGSKDYDVWKREAVNVIHREVEQEKLGDSSKKDKLISYERVLSSLFDSSFHDRWLPSQEEEKIVMVQRIDFLQKRPLM